MPRPLREHQARVLLRRKPQRSQAWQLKPSLVEAVLHVRPYLDRAAIYVCPITDGGGTKLKILDALAMGKAIVADPVACEGIEVTENKNVLFASSPRQYVEKIQFLLKNPDIRKEVGESARQLILKSYAYLNIGKKLSQIYEKVYRNTPV